MWPDIRGVVFADEKLPSEFVGMMMACIGASFSSSSSTCSLCWSPMALRPGGALIVQINTSSFYRETIQFGRTVHLSGH